MCPDDQIISLFIDDELPSPWKEKYEAHLVTCPNCQIRLEKFRELQTLLQKDRKDVPSGTTSRVWEKIMAASNSVLPAFAKITPFTATAGYRQSAFWKRSVSLPFPAAAAAAAIFVIITIFALQGVQPAHINNQDSSLIYTAGTDTQSMLPLTNLDEVLQYLSMEDTSDHLVIRLPDTRNFMTAGEPALVRAADYSRSRSSR